MVVTTKGGKFVVPLAFFADCLSYDTDNRLTPF